MFLILLVLYAISYAAMMVLEMAGLLLVTALMLLASWMHIHVRPAWTGIGIGFLAAGIVGLFLLYMTLSWASYAIAFSVLYDDQRARKAGMAAAPTGGLV